jgi:hypothetical protein
MFRIWIVVAAVLAAGQNLAAQTETTGLAGTWEFTVEAGDETHRGQAVFTLKGTEVGGTLYTDRGEGIITGNLTGASLTFTTTIGDLYLKWTGELKGTEIVNGILDYGEGLGTWVARRSAA